MHIRTYIHGCSIKHVTSDRNLLFWLVLCTVPLYYSIIEVFHQGLEIIFNYVNVYQPSGIN